MNQYIWPVVILLSLSSTCRAQPARNYQGGVLNLHPETSQKFPPIYLNLIVVPVIQESRGSGEQVKPPNALPLNMFSRSRIGFPNRVDESAEFPDEGSDELDGNSPGTGVVDPQQECSHNQIYDHGLKKCIPKRVHGLPTRDPFSNPRRSFSRG